jgi:hypothetical protein
MVTCVHQFVRRQRRRDPLDQCRQSQ